MQPRFQYSQIPDRRLICVHVALYVEDNIVRRFYEFGPLIYFQIVFADIRMLSAFGLHFPLVFLSRFTDDGAQQEHFIQAFL